jgi:hypothetical protein
MRAIFLEALIDMTRAAGLGIEAVCLYHIDTLVSRVSIEHATKLQDRATFVKAYGDFEEFVARMIADARSKGYSSLHEDTFFEAQGKCGLIFWCQLAVSAD